MLEAIARDLTNFLHANPHWGSFITFVVAFAESLAVIGTIVPGSVTMTAIGVMIGTAILPLMSTFVWATFGALTGDYLGYWLGKNYSQEIRNSRWLQGKRHWIEKGELFFKEHGGKSVIIGRFFGPVRSLIPMIAGLLQMPTFRFTIAVFPAAILWAIVYMTPGIILGAVALELPPSIATKFLLYGFVIIIFAWFILRVIKLFFHQIWYWFDQMILKTWNWMRSSKSFHWFTTLLTDPNDPDNHQQLSLTILMFFFALLFLCIAQSVISKGVLTYFNEPIFHLLSSIRTNTLDHIMLGITMIGERYVMLAFGITIQVYLLIRKQFRAAIHWFLLMAIGVGTALCIKHFYYNPRPNLMLPSLTSSSFPSGHVALSTLLFGFLSVLIGHELPREQKPIPYRVTTAVVTAIMFSRLYLGAHWLTDVIASMCLAVCVVLLITISYRRRIIEHISPKMLSIVALSSLVIIMGIYSFKHFTTELQHYQNTHKSHEIKLSDWWNASAEQVAFYRNNRLGKPKELLNIQWLGNLLRIENHLTQAGWQSLPPDTSIKNLLRRAAVQHDGYRLSLMPQQYQNEVADMLMIKNNLVFRLWDSHIRVTDSDKTLWLGSISPMLHHRKKEHQIIDINEIKSLINAQIHRNKVVDIPNDIQLPKNLPPAHQILKISE